MLFLITLSVVENSCVISTSDFNYIK